MGLGVRFWGFRVGSGGCVIPHPAVTVATMGFGQKADVVYSARWYEIFTQHVGCSTISHGMFSIQKETLKDSYWRATGPT